MAMNFIKGVLWTWAVMIAIVSVIGVMITVVKVITSLTGSVDVGMGGLIILLLSLLGGLMYSEGDLNE